MGIGTDGVDAVERCRPCGLGGRSMEQHHEVKEGTCCSDIWTLCIQLWRSLCFYKLRVHHPINGYGAIICDLKVMTMDERDEQRDGGCKREGGTGGKMHEA